MEVQIFGTRKIRETRKAERPASPGELLRFAQKFGVQTLVDRGSRRFADLGLGAARRARTTGIGTMPVPDRVRFVQCILPRLWTSPVSSSASALAPK